MQSPKMTTLLTFMFIVITTTSSFAAAAPTYAEAVDENVENLERGLKDEDERQFADVAEQEIEPAEQQGTVAQPHCFKICVKRGRFGVCVRWDRSCRRTLNNGEAESANVQGSEANLHQENVAEEEVGPVQQDAAVARHVAFGCRMECKRKVWKGCIDWTWKCRRSLDNQQGSGVDQQADVAEPEVKPVVQEEAVAQSHCTKICIVRDRNSGRCFRYYWKCPKRQ